MKKLFFTAIAMVAFSGMSMAHTIEDVSCDLDGEPGKPKMISCTRKVTKDCGGGSSITTTVTASVPSTGDVNIDMGKACANALAAANYNSSIAACP